MMKTLRYSIVIFIFSVLTFTAVQGSAQCAMCALNAENSVKNGNTQGTGLNSGIMYLLAAPYLAIAGVGLVWYKKYKRKNIPLRMKEEKINLN
jgi:hypothetical protein